MTAPNTVDGVLVQWGDRLFYPANRIVKPVPPPRLDASTRAKAATLRRRIVATVTRRAPQVMVKVTGGGRGMGAIAAHFRYISKNGRLEMEDDRGAVRQGREALRDLADQWRFGGSRIGEVGHRREAFNIMLSMPRGTDPQIVQLAAREFAQAALRGHRYVMVLHDHQANPHVHLSVRAESMDGCRLNPRKADLHRWRETFAEKLRGWGVEAEATRQASRGALRTTEALWRLKAMEEGRADSRHNVGMAGEKHVQSRYAAMEAWAHIMQALAASDSPEDQALALGIRRFANESPYGRQFLQRRQRQASQPDRVQAPRTPQPEPTRPGRDIER
ncbi:hypothetical protein BurJ1DRAFT_0908 [Burkholderiales bacterium JOSHI_001]|nr:hypothetical protein BurJ1DRAFT_0908 [Burkholderiales bacterium JOSHI_001]